MAKNKKIKVEGKEITIVLEKDEEYISLTDMLKAKDGDFFISDWLVTVIQLNTLEFGKVFTILILIMANSPQLKVKPA